MKKFVGIVLALFLCVGACFAKSQMAESYNVNWDKYGEYKGNAAEESIQKRVSEGWRVVSITPIQCCRARTVAFIVLYEKD